MNALTKQYMVGSIMASSRNKGNGKIDTDIINNAIGNLEKEIRKNPSITALVDLVSEGKMGAYIDADLKVVFYK